MTGPESGGPGSAERRGAGAPGNHHVELVGPHLRVRGRLSLGRYPRLADLINHNRGFIVLQDAELLERDGGAVSLRLPELLVNQDVITFISHEEIAAPAGPGLARQLMIFTPGHTISGSIHIFREMTLANFVEATNPRFLLMTDTTARSLIDPSVLIRAAGMLVNRTQINAIAETEQSVGVVGTADPAPRPA